MSVVPLLPVAGPSPAADPQDQHDAEHDAERDPERRSTDVGNAERLVDEHGDRFRYVSAWGSWLHWDGRRWARDGAGQIVEAAKAAARNMVHEAAELSDPNQRKQVMSWALKSESAQRIDAMIRLARSSPGIPVEPDRLDADAWLLNVRNGTIDLRTGLLLDHDPARLCTKLADVDYDPAARAPRWDEFLATVLPDVEVREFMARWSGYCLTGDVSEQKVVIEHGIGANGKSTANETLRHVLGDYAIQAAPDLLMRSRNDPHPTGQADLHGARLVLAAETGQNRKLDENLLKRLTGGDTISARKMHQDFFEFQPTHKIVVATNHRPSVDGTDHGIWRRIRLVPFSVIIADEDQDEHLAETLRSESAGILRWAVDACLRWQKDGLTEPFAVTAATADYRADMDVLGDFLSENCLLVDGLSTRASDLYSAYQRWAETMGETPVSQRKLGLILRERGLNKRTSGVVWWDGITLTGTHNEAGIA
jgi:putative DNA primase/helicase